MMTLTEIREYASIFGQMYLRCDRLWPYARKGHPYYNSLAEIRANLMIKCAIYNAQRRIVR